MPTANGINESHLVVRAGVAFALSAAFFMISGFFFGMDGPTSVGRLATLGRSLTLGKVPAM